MGVVADEIAQRPEAVQRALGPDPGSPRGPARVSRTGP